MACDLTMQSAFLWQDLLLANIGLESGADQDRQRMIHSVPGPITG